MNDDLQCWYKALELEPGASLEEVNQAHKDLALVWHPDRLPKDSLRLQEKAHEKLKEINNARDRLREYQGSPTARSPRRAKTTSQSSRNPRLSPIDSYQTNKSSPPRQDISSQPASASRSHWGRLEWHQFKRTRSIGQELN
jgi:hypothetical protein